MSEMNNVEVNQIELDNQAIAEMNELIEKEKEGQKVIFTEIGKVYYETVKAKGMLVPAEQTMLFAKVDASNEQIQEYKDKINEIKKIKECPTCGRECALDDVFCAKCGTRLPDNSVEEVVEVVVEEVKENICNVCGTKLQPNDMFCYMCGNKLG